jgi:hypothetical protein
VTIFFAHQAGQKDNIIAYLDSGVALSALKWIFLLRNPCLGAIDAAD